MSWLSTALGVLLGAGVLLAYRGIRVLADKSLGEAVRRRGFWWLNAGLALVAVSVIAFGRTARG